jgi:hypothetical protein
VVSHDDAVALLTALPEVVEGERFGKRTWYVGKKAFAWDRPLSKADVKRLAGAPAPDGPILALAAEDLVDKAAILAAGTKGFFDIEHFKGYPAFLVQLDLVTKKALREAVVDAWLAVAPPKVAEAHAATLLGRRR